jgi:hypothetical protein
MKVSAEKWELYTKKFDLTAGDFSNPKIRKIVGALIHSDMGMARMNDLAALDPRLDLVAAVESPEVELPAKQQKMYSPQLVAFYRAKFGLAASDLDRDPVKSLVRAKIDSDVLITSQTSEITKLKARVAALLGFVKKYGKLRTKVSNG